MIYWNAGITIMVLICFFQIRGIIKAINYNNTHIKETFNKYTDMFRQMGWKEKSELGWKERRTLKR